MNIHKIREDFPILSRTVYGKPLVYLDNGATTQKPRLVIDSIVDEYYSVNANVHRGVHFLSQQATELHEASRETVRQFINARSTREVIFTRGTTESINLIVSSFGEEFMQEGDEVIVSVMEHHSNIVPWQLLAARKGIAIKVIPMNDKGELLLEEYENLFSERTKIVSVTQVSNVLGTINPVKEMIATAHAVAREFGLNHHKFLRSWLECLAVLRNCCAHHSRLSNHVFPVKTKMPERMPNTWIADFSFREQTLYPQLCCVVYWLNSIVLENTFITDFKQLLISHPSVKTRLLGFPRNWEQEPLWR